MIDDPSRKMRFAYAIKAARERRGLTPPKLAMLLDVQPSTVNAWENPRKTAAPSILDLGPLCDALGVDANLFAVLPPIPAWEGETYLIDDPAERVARAVVTGGKSPQQSDGDESVDPGKRVWARS